MYKKNLLKINIVIIIMLIGYILTNNNNVNDYLKTLRTNSISVTKNINEPLYKEISEKAPQYEVLPEDAKIDRVWKAVPGYNGLVVDIDASYEKMKKDNKFTAGKLVLKETPPAVTLKDLDPAPTFKGNPNKQMVSFVINVAWGNEYLSSMIATLKKHNVKASFFLEGRWVKENPELAKMIVDAGHEVGNHSYTHADFKKITKDKMEEEIVKTNEVIKATTGSDCTWFAPPSGSFRDEAINVAYEHNLRTIMWTVDTIDWQKPPVSVLINRVISKVHPGALILMHPTSPTEQSLDQLIRLIKDKGLEINTVSTMLSEKR